MKKLLSVMLCCLLIFSCVFSVYAVDYDQDVDLDMDGFLTDNDGQGEPSTIFVEENENGAKGGYLTKSGDSYTANEYKNSTFEGWFDKEGKLITTDLTVTPEKWDKYYAARFNTENLINDSGFEGYGANQKVYDHTNLEKQIWTVHYMTKVEPLVGSYGSMLTSNAYKKSGAVSFKINPPWQLVGTNVKLQPNTEYYIGFDWLYTTKLESTYISDLQYGLFVPDSNNANMVAIANGSANSVSSKGIAQATWNKTGFIFKTGDAIPENVEFGIVFRVANDDESVSVNDKNNTQIYVDDIMVTKAEKFEVTVDATNVATTVPVNGSANSYCIKNEEYFFKVAAEPGANPKVSVNGEVVTPNAEGVYSFVPLGDTEIKIDCGAMDEGRPAHGKDYFGRDLTKYNAEVYLENIWEGDTVYHETALFLTGKDTVKLLYPVDEVVSLRSYSLDTTYIKGVDFEITEDGQIKRLEGSRIPVYSGELTTNVKPDVNAFLLRGTTDTWLKAIGDTTHAKTAIAVTYKHSKTFEDGYQPKAPESQQSSLKNTLAKLNNGKQVNIVVFGDSISCGWSSSGLNHDIYGEVRDENNNLVKDENGNTVLQLVKNTLNVAPYMPPFYDMVVAKLNELYPGQINFKNLALGGKSSPWGAQEIARRLALWKDEDGNQVVPDLMMIGFGVNDAAGRVTTANFKANMKAIVDNARTAVDNAEMEALYFSPFLPNQLTATWDINTMLDYENALNELAEADENVGLVKLTSIFAEVVKCKGPEDYISSYWNHGDDFTVRIYATGILQAMLGEEADDHIPGDVDGDDDVNLKDLVKLAQYVAGWEGLEVDENALDVDGDGDVDLDDVNRLAKYLAGWDVDVD